LNLESVWFPAAPTRPEPAIVLLKPGALPAAVVGNLSAMMTDPIADMLTRIRNAVRIERPLVDMPTSTLRRGVAQVLKDEGYVWDFEEIETVPAKTLRLHMKYGPNGERLITRIDRVSKPGCRVYRGYRDLKPILGGMGIQILSTPKGVISDRRARNEKVGGEVLALIH
jgi:small subunit ribosomal protein S8